MKRHNKTFQPGLRLGVATDREPARFAAATKTPGERTSSVSKKHVAMLGFSLIEIMVVVVVIGILAAAIIPQFMGTAQDAKIATAKVNVGELKSALTRFYVTMDRYPSNDEGLKVLVEAPTGEEKKWRGPYVDQVRPDPWGNPFQDRAPGTHHPTSFDIWSRGADGADGGEGDASDIGNW